MTRRYILDAGPAQDYSQKRDPTYRRALAARRAGHKLGICTPTLGELIGGFEGSVSRDRSLAQLERALADLILWPFAEYAAREYGRLWEALHRAGRPMQQIDIQVAAVAFALGGTTVVSTDSDLAAVPGLDVENWSLPEPTP